MEPDGGARGGWKLLQGVVRRPTAGGGGGGATSASAAGDAEVAPDAKLWNQLHSSKLMKAQVASVGTIRELRQALARSEEQVHAKDQRIGELLALLKEQSLVLARLHENLAHLQAQPRPGRLAVVTRNVQCVIDDEMGGENTQPSIASTPPLHADSRSCCAGVFLLIGVFPLGSNAYSGDFEVEARVQRHDGEYFVAVSCSKRWTHMSLLETQRRTQWSYLTNFGRIGTGATDNHHAQNGHVSKSCRCGELSGEIIPITEKYVELAALLRGVVSHVASVGMRHPPTCSVRPSGAVLREPIRCRWTLGLWR